jgi:Raf kinase inhibitor-like YbhB/YbcL family protein
VGPPHAAPPPHTDRVILAPVLAVATITLSSPAFANGSKIPARYTCDGKGTSPPLRWTTPPPGTRSVGLKVVDVSARGFVHWSATGIPASARGLREGQHAPHEGANGFGSRGWGGPCPPAGHAHEYVFTLSALDTRGKRLAQARLVGYYATE